MTRQPLITAEHVRTGETYTTNSAQGGERFITEPAVTVRVETTPDAIPDALDALHAAVADVRAQLESLTGDPSVQDVTR